jgi:hypothetical protein
MVGGRRVPGAEVGVEVYGEEQYMEEQGKASEQDVSVCTCVIRGAASQQ